MLTKDSEAKWYIKTASVEARFAEDSGIIKTLEGPVPYSIGDAILTGVKGEHWPVKRSKFLAMYVPVEDKPGHWKKKSITPVIAIQKSEPFSVVIRGGEATLHGKVNDWLVQYGPRDYGIVDNEVFMSSYKEV